MRRRPIRIPEGNVRITRTRIFRINRPHKLNITTSVPTTSNALPSAPPAPRVAGSRSLPLHSANVSSSNQISVAAESRTASRIPVSVRMFACTRVPSSHFKSPSSSEMLASNFLEKPPRFRRHQTRPSFLLPLHSIRLPHIPHTGVHDCRPPIPHLRPTPTILPSPPTTPNPRKDVSPPPNLAHHHLQLGPGRTALACGTTLPVSLQRVSLTNLATVWRRAGKSEPVASEALPGGTVKLPLHRHAWIRPKWIRAMPQRRGRVDDQSLNRVMRC
jgi:hypothetical protein